MKGYAANFQFNSAPVFSGIIINEEKTDRSVCYLY